MTRAAEEGERSAAVTGAITMTDEMEIASETTAMKDGRRDVKREVQGCPDVYFIYIS